MKMVPRFLSVTTVLVAGIVLAFSPIRAAAEPRQERAHSNPAQMSAPRGPVTHGPIRDPEPTAYPITSSAGPGGSISPEGTVTVETGGDLVVSIVPESYHHVTNVLVDGASMGAVTSTTLSNVSSPHVIEADFAIDTYLIDATAGSGGSIAPSGPISVSYGSDQSFTITSDAGYQIDDVTVDGVSIGAVPNTTLSGVSAEHVVAATFSAIHVIHASATIGGTIAPSGDVAVADLGNQTFTITPSANYHVVNVLVDAVSMGAITSYSFLSVTVDHTIAASFAIDVHTLAIDVMGQGSVTRTPDQATYDHGTPVSIHPVPDPGQRFVAWTGDVSGNADPLVLVMNADKHVIATFVESTPPVVSVIAPNGGQTVAVGETVHIQWSATDDVGVSGIDLAYSTTGAGGPFQAIATSLANTGTYSWLVPGPTSNQAVIRVTARDAAGNSTEDQSDAVFSIITNPVVPMVWLRADSASGSGPYAVPGNTSPWVDVAGNHDAVLWNFTGTPASGWKGDGTTVNPYRLEFAGEEQGINNRTVIPGYSVPELQSIGATTTAVWFKTGFDGTNSRYEYVLEWVQVPASPYDPAYEGRGMSIIVQEGEIQVYANPWIHVCPAQPNTWYHVVVVKDTMDMRIYVNGQKLFSGVTSHRGTQDSEIVLGASTFRVFENVPFPIYFNDYFTGAVSQLYIGQGAMTDGQVQGLYEADSHLFPSPGQQLPTPNRVVTLRANQADGVTHYASPGAGSPWMDLQAPATNGVLLGFDGNAASGWQGDGSAGSPYRLHFDGVDDRVVLAAGSIPQFHTVSAVSAEAWIKPAADVSGPDFRYVFEWVQGQGSTAGMSLAIADGHLQLFTATPYWTDLGPISVDAWHHVVVTKQPGEVRVYLDGNRIFSGIYPNIGDQTSEVVLGASTWRGPSVHGDFFPGDIGSFTLWEGALDDAQVAIVYTSDNQFGFGLAGVTTSQHADLALAGFRPNPVMGRLRVALTLPNSSPASLELLDVAGRRVRSREIGSMGPGHHVIDLGGSSDLKAGLYFLRLTQEGSVRTAKATIVR